jgi:predicted outer membrane protein
VLAIAACTGGADAPANDGLDAGPHGDYARALCEAQARNLDAGLTSIAEYGDALESEALDVRAAAVRGVLAELSEQSTELLEHLNATSPPTGDEAFIQVMRDGEREVQDALAEARSIAADATSHEELDSALETMLAAFEDDLDARAALAEASDELESALRAEPACESLF